MHTAICSFEHRDIALRARDRLLESGFAERDVHLQHRGPAGSHGGEDPRGWEGTDHEIAVDRGFTVVVVDTEDEAEAARARALLHDLQAADLNVIDRPKQRPLHEILGERMPHRSGGLGGSYQDRSSAFDTEPARPAAERERERATAAGGPVDKAEAPSASRDWVDNGGRDPMADRERRGEAARGEDADLDKVGLRYSDKDKPGL